MGHLSLESLGQDPDAVQEACCTFALTVAPPPRQDVPHLFLDPDHRFQRFLGMGLAITDASAEVFAKLPKKAQRTLLNACWSPTEGNGHRFCQTSVRSCDFSSASYTYCEEGDDELKSFSIAAYLRYRIPMIQAAQEASGGQLQLLASPWSAPVLGCSEHWALARESVLRSLVLLKNYNALLPLRRSARVLLAGKSAHDLGNQCGGFTVEWQGAQGNRLIEGDSTGFEGVRALATACDFDSEGHSADPAKHDVAVVVIGERPYAEGLGDIRSGEDVLIQEGSQIRGKLKKLEPYGQAASLEALHPEDLQTLTRIKATGVPVVTVMLCGRPLATDPELAQSDASVGAWLPGSEGAGIGETLFAAQPEAEALFPGRLPFAWPRDGDAPQWQDDEQLNVRFPRGYPWPR